MNNTSFTNRFKLHLQSLWFDGWAKGIALLVGLALLAIGFVITYKPESHQHDGYVTAEVLFIHDLTMESGRKLAVQIRLPDGTGANIRTRSLVAVSGVGQVVCVERRTTASEKSHYVLKSLEHCQLANSKDS